MIYSFVALPNQ